MDENYVAQHTSRKSLAKASAKNLRVQVEEGTIDDGDQSIQYVSNRSSTRKLHSILKTNEDRNVSRFVAQPPKPFKMNIASSKYLLNEFSKDDVYIPPDDDTEEDEHPDLGQIKHLNKDSTKSLVMNIPKEKSQRLLSEASMKLSLRLRNLQEVEKNDLKSRKFEVRQSPSFVLDRSMPADIATGTHYFKRRGMSVSDGYNQMQSTALHQINEELSYDKDDKAKQKPFKYATKYLGGTNIFPKYSDSERKKKFVVLDQSC